MGHKRVPSLLSIPLAFPPQSVSCVGQCPQSLSHHLVSESLFYLLYLLFLALPPWLFFLSLPSQYRLGYGLAQSLYLDCLEYVPTVHATPGGQSKQEGKAPSMACWAQESTSL